MKKNAVRVALHKRSVHFLHLKKIHETPSPPPASALPSPSLPPMPITSGPLPFSSGACAIASATAASSSGRGRLRCCCRPQPRRPSRRHRWHRRRRRRHFPPPQSPSSVGRPTSHVASPASLSLPPPWPHRCRRRRRWHARRGCRYPPPPSPSPRAGNLPVLALAGILTLAACAGDLPGVALAACAGDLPAVAFTTPGQRERDDSPVIALPAHASPKPPSPRALAICLSCELAICLSCELAIRQSSPSPRMAITCTAIHPSSPPPRVPTSCARMSPSPRAPAICPPDVALAMHAGDLPTVAFSARGHRERDDSHAVALATRDSYSPDVALTARR